MREPKSVKENETHKIRRDFEIQTNLTSEIRKQNVQCEGDKWNQLYLVHLKWSPKASEKDLRNGKLMELEHQDNMFVTIG